MFDRHDEDVNMGTGGATGVNLTKNFGDDMAPIQYEALELSLKGVPMKEIARQLKINQNTLAEWKRMEKWKDAIRSILGTYFERVVGTFGQTLVKLDELMNSSDEKVANYAIKIFHANVVPNIRGMLGGANPTDDVSDLTVSWGEVRAQLTGGRLDDDTSMEIGGE